jgi:NADPH-dependent 2,4-dienoyl-CoA reductase/sulfur reductase-like enzyme/rhodanese-related sulfurtransferase
MKIVIVGGVAGGASAAARLRRLDESSEIILLQSGPDVSFASCGMPYYIGQEITNRDVMAVQTPASLKSSFNLDVRVNTTVTHIDTNAKTVTAKPTSSTEQEEDAYTIQYDELILAVGAAPLKPPIPGIDRPGLFAMRNLQDMDNIYNWLNDIVLRKSAADASSESNGNKPHCVVAGAGFVGLETAEQLIHRGCDVTIVELMPQILGPLDPEMAAYLHTDLEQEHGVTVIVNDGIQRFDPDPNDPEHSTILTLQSGRVLPTAQMTILGLGVRPDTQVVKEAKTIECTPRGHIVVNEFLQTSAPHVWAVGDAVEVINPILTNDDDGTTPPAKWAVPLAGPANRQGRLVADLIYKQTTRGYKGTYGVSVVRSFDLYAATVGLNEKFCRSANIPNATVVHIHPNSHAGYYPGAQSIHLKLIFDKETGKIYGAQAVGKDGVEKRIDVIATAMQGNLNVQDLADLELCYAPPVGSAKDPVNFAGMVAQNVRDGMLTPIQHYQMNNTDIDPSKVIILDVRNPDELALGQIPDYFNVTAPVMYIPLNELRSRIAEISDDKNQRIVVTCRSGQRAYYASRILQHNGFSNVESLDGAFLTYSVLPKNKLDN